MDEGPLLPLPPPTTHAVVSRGAGFFFRVKLYLTILHHAAPVPAEHEVRELDFVCTLTAPLHRSQFSLIRGSTKKERDERGDLGSGQIGFLPGLGRAGGASLWGFLF